MPAAYQLSTVTYGTTCAPYLSIRVLHQLAKDEEQRFPLAAGVVRRNVYVDDALAGSDEISTAHEMVEQVDGLFRAGGFRLHKWSSNVPIILSSIEPERRVKINREIEETPVLRALGLSWSPVLDTFIFEVRGDYRDADVPTKRSVLSFIAKLFDPLGWLAPVIVRAKILLQSLWHRNLDWDEALPEQLRIRWTTYVHELRSGAQFSIPRWIGVSPHSQIEIHGFSDASTDALGAAVYVRVLSNCYRARTSLMLAKTKVALMKKVTITRLELTAAVLLCHLVVRVLTCFDDGEFPVYLWTDSAVALAWIRADPARWKEFVANRVEAIHELVPRAQWHHVPGTENPADLASRGLSPLELKNQQIWWEGPSWLSESSCAWPTVIPDLPEGVEQEERSTGAVFNVR